MRQQQRRRRVVGRTTFALLRPFVRYSLSRDAYVLRGVGNRFGPVYVTDEVRARASTDNSPA